MSLASLFHQLLKTCEGQCRIKKSIGSPLKAAFEKISPSGIIPKCSYNADQVELRLLTYFEVAIKSLFLVSFACESNAVLTGLVFFQ